jgi:hypothetical protein
MPKANKVETGAGDNSDVIESAESTNKNGSTGGEETTESSSKKAAGEGNFLTDILDQGNDTEDQGADEGGDQGGESAEQEDQFEGAGDITADMAGEELAVGDTLYKGGKPVLNGTVELADGTVCKTNAEGKVTSMQESDEESDQGGESEEEDENIMELVDNENTEKYDLRKAEDRAKVKERAQKGLRIEREMATLKKKSEDFDAVIEQHGMRENTMAHNLLYLQSQGKINAQEFIELPYEEFIGSSEEVDKEGNVIRAATKEGDLANWNKHKQQVAAHNKVLQDYAGNFRRVAAGYQKMVSDFSAKHPEIKDVKAWINEHLGRFSAPILNYGASDYDPETLEMVYSWINRNKIERRIREDERRKKAKAVVREDKNKSGKTTHSSAPVDSFLNSVVSVDTRKIVN